MTKNRRPLRGFSRREFMQAAAAAAGGTMFTTPALALDPRGRKSQSNHPDPDLILVDGRIHTMDAKNRVVSSVAIKNGRFIEVGNVGRGHYGGKTKVIDLEGRTVVPGIIDNHNHLVLMGNRPGFHTPLENAHSIAEALAIYAARAARVPAGAWITTIGGFHFNHLYANPTDKTAARFPTLAELDRRAPNNPVWLSISFNGPSVTNTAGRNIFEGWTSRRSRGRRWLDRRRRRNNRRVLLYLRRTLLNPAARRRGRRRHEVRGERRGNDAHRPGRLSRRRTPRATARRMKTTSRCTSPSWRSTSRARASCGCASTSCTWRPTTRRPSWCSG